MSDTTLAHPDIVVDGPLGDNVDLLLRSIQAHLDSIDGPTLEDLEKPEPLDDFQPRSTERGWRQMAACRGMDPSMFYPERGDNEAQKAAKAVCGGCPVREACLQEAVDNGERFGIWGGANYDTFKKISPSGSNQA